MNILEKFTQLFQNRTIVFQLIIAGILVIIVIVLVITMVISQNRTNEITPPNPSPTSFNRISPTQTPIEKAQEAQSKADKNFGDAWTQIYKDFPFYNEFPISASEYFIYVDLTKKKIVAKLYPESSSVQSLQQQVISRLTLLGIDLNKNPVEWEISPQ